VTLNSRWSELNWRWSELNWRWSELNCHRRDTELSLA
jgi:hypothetical protein